MKGLLILSAILTLSGCGSCSFSRAGDGETHIRPLAFTAFTVQSDDMIVRNEAAEYAHYIIDTQSDQVKGKIRFEAVGSQPPGGYQTIYNIIVSNRLYIIPISFPTTLTKEIWIINPETAGGRAVRIHNDMPFRPYYLESHDRVLLTHSVVYSYQTNGGNSPVSVFDTTGDTLKNVLYSSYGLHAVTEGRDGRIYCITGYFGESRLAELTLEPFKVDHIAPVAVQGINEGLNGSPICNPVSNEVWVSDGPGRVIRVYNAATKTLVASLSHPAMTNYTPGWLYYYQPLNYIIAGFMNNYSVGITVYDLSTRQALTNLAISGIFEVHNHKLYCYEWSDVSKPVDVYSISNHFQFISRINLR